MKKKGFTLIELLAVIVILAIIALIATPLVLKYIEKSRHESFKVSVENIKDSALKYVANEQLSGKVTYPVIVDVQDLDFKGKEDYEGKLIIKKNGIVEEYIEKNNYQSRNSVVSNNKNEPYLKVKEGQTAIIDDKNGYVYSFYTSEHHAGYLYNKLTEEVLNSAFEVVNGIISYETNGMNNGPYSTGAKIIIKDNDGNIHKEYTIIIFGDIDRNGAVNSNDGSLIKQYYLGNITLSDTQIFASDVNRDGRIDENDSNLLLEHMQTSKRYNQLTYKLEGISQ